MLRELLRQPKLLLIEALTGAHIQTVLPEHFPSTRERVPDLIALLTDGSALHLEVMGYNDPEMADRMWDVRGLFRRAFPGYPPLKQVVVYVGRAAMKMADGIEEPGVSFRYSLVDIRTLAAGPFLASPRIEDNLIGVLCRGGNNREYVRKTLKRIAGLPSVTERKDAVTKFAILSMKRGLMDVVEEEEQGMPFTLDLEDDPFLQRLHAKGVEEGRQEGRQEGRHLGQVQLAQKILTQRFGPLPPWAQAALEGATEEQVEAWLTRSYAAASLEEVLRPV